MSAPPPICLKFAKEINETVRARISYAFRVFAAIYNHRITADDSEGICCAYGGTSTVAHDTRVVRLPALYKLREKHARLPDLVKYSYAKEEFWLSYGLEEATLCPDWLGEIFEWITCSHEMNSTRRDGIGRIPYSETVFSRQSISPRKPYALLLMSWLENYLQNGNVKEALPRAESPIQGVDHAVVCSHDFDFYFTGRVPAFARLVKNLAISYRPYRSWPYFQANSAMLLKLLGGKRVGDYLPPLLKASEEYEFRSTIFVVARQGHRRDPSYRLAEIAPQLSAASKRGFSIGLHGSYTSIMEEEDLLTEVAELNKMTGGKTLGSRQHWLRFDCHEKLFRAVERAHLAFDSSLGFVERVGFRNGASFAFPPYNFEKEEPHRFLEIPLALMDGNLETTVRASGEKPENVAEEILSQSRRWGWGGIAALWHNPTEPIQVPEEINRVFWACVKNQKAHGEKWMSASQFLAHALVRYQNAGLLPGVQIDA